MKTLVIHPNDRSTNFLCLTYQYIADMTLITDGISKNTVKEMLSGYDRVILLGHGSADGLFSMGQFKDSGIYIIDKSFAPLLNEVKDLICIWCYADSFVGKHLSRCGLYTGMFISEMSEALFYLEEDVDAIYIEESNCVFGETLGKHITEMPITRFENLIREYKELDDINPIVAFNSQRLYNNLSATNGPSSYFKIQRLN